MVTFDGVITIGVLLLMIFVVYSGIKKQSLRDTWEEILDLFRGKGGIKE